MSVERVAVLAYHSSPEYEPGAGDGGGMTVYVRSLAEALAQRWVETDIFTRQSHPSSTIVSPAPGVRIVPVPAGPASGLTKEELPTFIDDFITGVDRYAVSSGRSYDVVHSHYWQSGLAGRSLSARWNVPLVHSHHTLGMVKNSLLADGDAPEPQFRLDGEREVIRAADVLVASTDEECEQLACLYGASHDWLKTIHPGVDHTMFEPANKEAARAALGLRDEAVLLYVGRIQPLKGLDLGIRSLPSVIASTDKKVTLVVVGGPSGAAGERELDRLRSLIADLGVASNVRFVGPQPHSSLPGFYQAADVVVVCSHSESFGFAALEAHACGTPVVASAVGGLSFIVRDGISGFLVPNRDEALFAEKLALLVGNEELRDRFGVEAVASAARFSWPEAADKFLTLYECLVREEFTELCTC